MNFNDILESGKVLAQICLGILMAMFFIVVVVAIMDFTLGPILNNNTDSICNNLRAEGHDVKINEHSKLFVPRHVCYVKTGDKYIPYDRWINVA